MQRKDFSGRRSFPGTHNNDFDIVLRVMDMASRLPAPVIWLIQLGLAWAVCLGHIDQALLLWAFLLGDYVLIWLLPRAGRSFGPPNPPVLLLAVARLPFWLIPGPFNLLLEAAGSLLVIYGFWFEPFRLTVTQQTLTTPKLRAGSRLRLLHLGDLHIERETMRERRLLALIAELRPDLIAFSGDFLNLSYLDDARAQADCRSILEKISAPLGVYAVTGSPAVDFDETAARLLAGLPWRWLRNEAVPVACAGGTIDIVGMVCTHKPFVDGPILQSILAGRPEGFRVLIYHSPDLAPDAAETGRVDLQLSGHTHGGQVRLPWYGALITASLYGKLLESGRRQLDRLTLYVTRGIGMEGAGAPRVRFLCPPEIILWEISGTGPG